MIRSNYRTCSLVTAASLNFNEIIIKQKLELFYCLQLLTKHANTYLIPNSFYLLLLKLLHYLKMPLFYKQIVLLFYPQKE